MSDKGHFIIHHPNGDETRLAIKRVSGPADEDRYHLASARRCEEKNEAVAEMTRIAQETHASVEIRAV